MARQNINIGSSANDGTGDGLRTAFEKTNSNFTELYANTSAPTELINGTSNIAVSSSDGNVTVGIANLANVAIFTQTSLDLRGNLVANGNISASSLSLSGSVSSNLVPIGSGVLDLGSDTNRWGDLYLTGSTIVLGDIVLKDNGSNTLGIFASDGTTAGTVSISSVDASGIDSTGNIIGADIQANANITAGGFFVGDGRFLSNVTATSNAAVTQISDGTTVVSITSTGGNINNQVGGQQTLVLTSTGANVGGYLTTTGNITGGNLITTGVIDAGTFAADTIAATGNVSGANLTTAGNVSGGNLVTAGVVDAGTVSATGNVTGGNLTTGAEVVAVGNISGGNIISNGAFIGNGRSLTSLAATALDTGTVPDAQISSDSVTQHQGNIAIDASQITSGTISDIQIPDLPTTKITSGVFSDARISSSSVTQHQANIDIAASQVTSETFADARISSDSVTQHQANITGTGALNSGSITSGFGSINIGTDTVTAGGLLNANTDGVGNIGASGTAFNTVFAKATSAQYADVAELYSTDQDYAAGTVMVFGGSHEVTQSQRSADPFVAGVVSTHPAYLMNDQLDTQHTVALALLGRVPVRVRGPVQRGQMLVSDSNGFARAESKPEMGTVIGKALEDFSGEEGTIEVVVGRL